MSPSQRDAVIDVHLRDRTYAEVATKLGVPVGTVKSRVDLGLRPPAKRCWTSCATT